MLTALELENFKGIGPRQRIELKPLTLLFGANSAGKSTILQALIYLHELIERGSADVDRTELGGQVMELGGFARLVHRHDKAKAIVLRAEFDTGGGLERFGYPLGFPFPDLDDDIQSAWIELTVRFHQTTMFIGPIVERAVFGVNGLAEPLVTLLIGGTLRDDEPLEALVNNSHPLIADNLRRHATAWAAIAIRVEEVDDGTGANADAVSDHQCPVFAVSRIRLSALPSPFHRIRLVSWGDGTMKDWDTVDSVTSFLELIVLGATARLAAFLRESLYIGPLRTVPSRGALYERPGRIASWADGLAAWELLLGDRLTLVERTNAWLRKLGAGCKVVVQQLFDTTADAEQIAEEHVDYTARRLLLETDSGSRVLPSEVGAGISQLVPVVVAALEGRGGLMLVEQPELHVHPAVQVQLGDLLIEAIRERPRRLMLIETHSEHLILRLLRRIRETTDSGRAESIGAFGPDKLSVVYIQKPDEGEPDGVQIRKLGVDAEGEFEDRWPKGFFTERMQELL